MYIYMYNLHVQFTDSRLLESLGCHGLYLASPTSREALMDAATEKKEVVLVTDDVLTIKDKFQEEREIIGNRGLGGNHCIHRGQSWN